MTDQISLTATEAEIDAIVAQYRRVAIVGLSPDPERPSYQVAAYLKDRGFEIFPVNPKCQEVLGRPCYPDLRSVPPPVEIVDIFRQVEAIPAIVDEAIAVGARVVWMQLGLESPEAAAKARAAGLQVVMNRCLKIETSRRLPAP